MSDLNYSSGNNGGEGASVSPEYSLVNIPAWLDSPPDEEFPALPINTRLQTLPFGELTWENFERLIKRIVSREETIADCWIYGVPGQKQFGLDILATANDDSDYFVCYQCKRVRNYTSDDIKKAVDKFLEGKWFNKTKKLVFCVSSILSRTECIDEVNNQIKRLSLFNIIFEVWDGAEGGVLAEKLKVYPDLVDDFFSREWVRHFNGEDAASLLGERLQGLELNQLRLQLNDIYKTLFLRHDPGLRLGSQRPSSLISRYIPPTVIESRNVMSSDMVSEEKAYRQYDDGTVNSDSKPKQYSRNKPAGTQEINVSLDEWFTRQHRSVILGEPGFGKSTLLRVMALQLLSTFDEPIKTTWNNLLPVWISFGGFSSALQANPLLSFEDYFDNWLHQNAADDVRPLFRRAIKQGGMLLLVDGLDEGQDIDVAKQAMDRISSFLAIRSIPAVFTSRPRGYERVRPDGNWPVAKLSAFDKSQIEQFANMWFEYLELPDAGPVERISERVQQRTNDFLKATQVNSRIIELAQTPLFCQLLIDIFRFSHHLPEQRVKVYEKIIELLISDHPSARSQAAGISGNMLPRSEDMREMLMRLALDIQERGGAGVVSVEACQDSFCNFLTDDINGPGLKKYDAKYQAQIITDYALSGLGLMIERSPNELGFFHLTIQEYLAAQAMLRKKEEEQLNWLIRVWNLPQWHEVILAWFSIRGMDQGKGANQRAIDFLKESVITPWENIQLLVLRTELAANDFGLSPREARATIEQAAKEIEITPFRKIRLVLSGYIAQGLRSSSVNSICEAYITKWTQTRDEWCKARLFRTLCGWKPSGDLLQALKLGLHDEDLKCRWASAESLAKLYSGNDEVKNELSQKVRMWPDLEVRAAALYCLWKGWPNYEALNEYAEVASKSICQSFAIAGVLIKISKNQHSDIDLEKICQMYFTRTVDYDLEGICCELLVKGWGGDEKLKEKVLIELDLKFNQGVFEVERFISFLVRAWPGDNDVANHVVRYVKKYSIAMMHGSGLWQAIISGFGGNKELINAIRDVLIERKEKYKAIYWGPDTKNAYLAIGDDVAKKEMLEAYSQVDSIMDKHWICSTLMTGWKNDPEVQRFFSLEFLKPPVENAILANWVHVFINDKDARRSWLLGAITTGNDRGVLSAVGRLLDEFNDEECIDTVKDILTKKKYNYYSEIDIKNRLIEIVPKDPVVKQWVMNSFEEIDSLSLSSIAIGYEDNTTVREKILNALCPIHSYARTEIFRIIREHLMPSESIMRVTSSIFVETKPLIRTSGLIARCIAIQHYPDDFLLFKQMLCKELDSVGMVYEMRRRSAFAALLFLKEYDYCAEYLSREQGSSMHWLFDHKHEDILSARILFESWDALKNNKYLSNKDVKISWSNFIHDGTARGSLNDSSSRGQLVACLKNMSIKEHNSQSLFLMADLLPASNELRDCLVEIMSQQGNISYYVEEEKIAIAQSIYAEQFHGDAEAYNALEEIWKSLKLDEDIHSEYLFNVLYALAVGWPNSKLIQAYVQITEQPKVFLHIALILCGVTGDLERAQECIDAIIKEALHVNHPFLSLYIEALNKWSYTESADILLQKFLKGEMSSHFITALKLLTSTGRASEEFRLNMVGYFNNQFNSDAIINEGVDIFNGEVVSVIQIIVDECMLMTL